MMITSLLAGPDMNVSFVSAVVITGFTVTFAGLLLLIVFLYVMGAIFKKKNAPKSNGGASADQSAKPKITKAVMTSGGAAAAINRSGIPEEVVAAISAAIAMIGESTGKKLKIRSISASERNSKTNAWARAGRIDNTRPF